MPDVEALISSYFMHDGKYWKRGSGIAVKVACITSGLNCSLVPPLPMCHSSAVVVGAKKA